MGCKRGNSTRRCIHYSYTKTIGLIIMLFYSTSIYAQREDEVVKALVRAGFENVSRGVIGDTEVITFENSVWKADGEGVAKAISIIEKYAQIPGMIRRVVVLQLGVPQISLELPALPTINQDTVSLHNWHATYDLGKIRKQYPVLEMNNRSNWKVYLVVYPEFALRNQKYRKIYDILVNLSPAIEISPMKGMKLTGQVIIPVFNEYGPEYEQVRPGFVTISQQFRVTNNFINLTAGIFNQKRWGFDLQVFHPFVKEGWLSNFALQGRIGLTGSSYFWNWNWHYGPTKLVTWNLGGSYFNAMFNVLCEVKVEKFLAGDFGVRADMTRHFKRVSVGFYVMKNNRGNLDGGFHFAIALPPMGLKRGKWFRVNSARYFDFQYRAAGLFYNGKSYETKPGENKAIDNFNPKYIKSQLN